MKRIETAKAGANIRGTQLIDRALGILRIVATGAETGVSISDIVRESGLARSTASRIVQALVRAGMIEHPAGSMHYAVGHQIVELAMARQAKLPLLVSANAIIDQLARQVGDTIFFSVRTGADTLCVARRIGSYPIQVLSIDVGSRRALGLSSAGIAMLAAMGPAEAASIISANTRRFTANKVSAATVAHAVRTARAAGYCIRHIGLIKGTKSMSAWIKGIDTAPVGAITVTAVTDRLNPRREAEVAERLIAAARKIEQKLSH